MLELSGISKTYEVGGKKQRVLKHVNLNFRESEFAAILGPSGSGKTTLLNIIGGLDNYDGGDLKINEISTKNFSDKDWDAYRNHRIGFVFQSYNLIPHQTILSNVKLALTLSGISKAEATRRAKQALEEVGLGEHINKRPSQLSGGQMQRVAIARALVNNPDILLADEPTGALDSETSVQIMKILKKVARTKLVVMVTHNPELAREYATRIITLKDGEITSDSNIYDGKIKTQLDEDAAAKKQHKTKMSFFTALGLSLNNLLTKKARTILVAVAGSIGIIGIALILAVSTGFQAYIDKIEHDTLTSYPLMLQRESTDITGMMLSLTGGNLGFNDGKLHENQVITSTLGNVSQNDLNSFMDYLDENRAEVDKDIRLIEYEYNIDPVIYTEDATGKIAKLNPNTLFSSILGESSLLNSYSNLTSVFQQYDLENMKNDTEIVVGRYPEKYNEMVVFLNNKDEITDFMTYSLGFHDTEKLSEIIKSIMGGEKVNLNDAPLTLEYDDLLNLDLRMVLPADLYKYNSKYDVYEDMSEDAEYVKNLYENNSEKLKIVGVVTSAMEFSAGNGVLYLPSLVTHIIEESSETEIVKKQLMSPTIDVFSNTKFGESKNDFSFEFADLVSVDENKIASAFSSKIDQAAVTAKVEEYMNEISGDITADVGPVENELTNKFKTLAENLFTEIAGVAGTGTYTEDEISEIVENYVATQSFADLTEKYYIPEEQFSQLYAGLLKALLSAYAEAYKSYVPIATDAIGINKEIYGPVIEMMLQTDEIVATFNAMSITITEIIMKSEVLTAVGGLTSYLSSSFANAVSLDQDALLSAFTLNFSQDELTRVVQAMFTKKEATLSTNLALMGYQALDDPEHISFYFNTFDGKTHFMEFLDAYNDKMSALGKEDKVIEYSDTTGMLMSSVKIIVDAVSYVLIAFVSISLIVSSIMIGVITYISVYERTKEIGILRAIGASKRNISNIFNAETFIIGLLSGLFGIGFSYLVIPLINLVLHHFTGDIPLSAQLYPNAAAILIILSIVLTLIGGLIPAKAASKKDPVEALRTE